MYSIKLQNLLTSAKDHKKKKLKESYNDFPIYYNDREHSTTKVAHFRAMMNVENRDLIFKIKENTNKITQKTEILQKIFEK